jgi:hypothetical protein
VRAKLKQLARLLGMPQADLNAKLADEDKTFVWVKRQLDWDVGQQIAALDIKGIYQRKEYKRQYPEGEAAAHVVGFTNVEDKGQEGMELAFNSELAGRAGSRRVIKDRLGRVVEGVGETDAAGGRPRHAAVHRQQGAVLCLPKAARSGGGAQGQGRQRGGARRTPASCWRWPTTPAMCPTSART